MNEKLPLNIKQTAQLYGVSSDTLRYYESVGLITPRRERNSYRVYGEVEFARLNIVMSMLEMNFTLSDIRDYLSSHGLEKTIELFNKEMDRIDETISKLLLRRRKIEQCLRSTTDAVLASGDSEPRLRHRGARHYIVISEDSHMYADPLPYYTIKKAHELGINIDSLHSNPCFVMDYTRLRYDDCFVPEKALLAIEKAEYHDALVLPEGTYLCRTVSPCFVMDYTRLRYDDCFVPEKALLAIEKAEYHDALVLPEGTYLCRTVRGPAQLTPVAFEEMSAFMQSHSLAPRGKLLEFWHVSEYVSDDDSEYLHTLEIMVEQQQ